MMHQGIVHVMWETRPHKVKPRRIFSDFSLHFFWSFDFPWIFGSHHLPMTSNLNRPHFAITTVCMIRHLFAVMFLELISHYTYCTIPNRQFSIFDLRSLRENFRNSKPMLRIYYEHCHLFYEFLICVWYASALGNIICRRVQFIALNIVNLSNCAFLSLSLNIFRPHTYKSTYAMIQLYSISKVTEHTAPWAFKWKREIRNQNAQYWMAKCFFDAEYQYIDWLDNN